MSLYVFRSNEQLQAEQEIMFLMGDGPLGYTPHTYTQNNNIEKKE